MQGEGQFDDAEIGSKVAAVFRQLGDQFLADFLGEGSDLLDREVL